MRVAERANSGVRIYFSDPRNIEVFNTIIYNIYIYLKTKRVKGFAEEHYFIQVSSLI